MSALAVAGAAFAVGCGGVPSDSVATVADNPIPVSTYNHWSEVAAKSQSASSATPVPAINPPDFPSCVAALKLADAKSKKSQPDSAYKSSCQSQFDQTKQQVMQLLITSAWIEGQASAMGIKASSSEVQAQFEKTKKQAFPNDAQYQKFLQQSGEDEKDILYRIKIDMLSQRIRDAIIKNAGSVSDSDIQKYYDAHPEQYGSPPKRDIRMILAPSEDAANKAKAALGDNPTAATWGTVAKQYSTDTQTKNTGGLIKGAVKGQQDPALDKAAFAAKENVVVGPVKGNFGWYVVEVSNIVPGKTTPLAQIKPQVSAAVKAQAQQKALSSFVTDFQKKWKDRTECAKYYIIPVCGNAPKQQAPTQPGATVQQSPPAGG